MRLALVLLCTVSREVKSSVLYIRILPRSSVYALIWHHWLVLLNLFPIGLISVQYIVGVLILYVLGGVGSPTICYEVKLRRH
jgi:hypothetical protein